jgi:hypothetical protein
MPDMWSFVASKSRKATGVPSMQIKTMEQQRDKQIILPEWAREIIGLRNSKKEESMEGSLPPKAILKSQNETSSKS